VSRCTQYDVVHKDGSSAVFNIVLEKEGKKGKKNQIIATQVI